MAEPSILQALSRIAGYTQPAAIHTDEDLWTQVEQRGVPAVATDLSLTDQQLLEVLIAAATKEADRFRPSWLRRHALDLMAVCLVASVLAALWLRVWPRATGPQVVARHSLAPFQQIFPQDLEVRVAGRQAGSFERLSDLDGRYALQPLAAGAVITKTGVSTSRADTILAGRTVVLLPLKLNKSSLPWKPPVKLALVVSPRQAGAAPVVLNDALVLAMAGTDDAPMAYVALEPADLARFAALAASSDILVGAPVPK